MQIQLKLAAQCEGQGFQSNIKAFLKITTAFLWVQMYSYLVEKSLSFP